MSRTRRTGRLIEVVILEMIKKIQDMVLLIGKGALDLGSH